MNAELKFTPLIFAWGAGIFFIGYFIFEVPSNLALEKFGAQPLDRPHHGDLGHHLGVDGNGERRDELLRPALPARRRRSRILPRHHSLSDLLVSGGISRAASRGLCDRGSRVHRDRRADLGLAARARRRDGAEGLAVAVHHRGHSLGAARHRTWFYLTDRPEKAGLADARNRRRGSPQDCRPRSRPSRRPNI